MGIQPRDVFLSHAFEDKDERIVPLARALDDFAISYWLDVVDIGWGDSIVAKLNEGLTASRYVLVFLTEHFLRKAWTNRELEAAYAAEVASGEIIVLPILAAPQEDVFKVYPLLRPKKYLRADLGNERIAAEVSRLLGREFKSAWMGHHPAAYSGPVWIRVLKRESSRHEQHMIRLKWGPWRLDLALPSDSDRSVVLVHGKGNDGLSVPILADIEPPCFVQFGVGDPPAGTTLDIHHGWIRTND